MPKLDSTFWFAVDSVGHVASFAPGRRGAVPGNALTADSLAAFLIGATGMAQKLAATLPASWPASQAPARTPERCVLAVDDAVRGYRDAESLALLRALEPDVSVLRASGPRLLATKFPLDEAQSRALLGARVTLGLWSGSAVADLLAHAAAVPNYAYEHEGADAPPGLYRRVAVPEVPLDVRVLPDEARVGIQTKRRGPTSAQNCATPKGTMAKRKRRAGSTETVGVSLDASTRQKLKALAAARHDGNVSALIAEMTEEAVRKAAFERAWQWYGGPEPTEGARARIDAELEEGWALSRKRAAKKTSRRRKAA